MKKNNVIKANVIAIAKHHKKNCNGDCGCSMILLGTLLMEAGYKISKKEMKVFV